MSEARQLPDYFIRLADRLSQVPTGSLLADLTIHAAIGRDGLALPYTTDEATARLLLPEDFEWLDPTYSGGQIYAAYRCRRLDGDAAHPHVGQWGKTVALAMCGAAMRVRARLMKEDASS